MIRILTLIISAVAIVLLTGADQLIKVWAIDSLKGQPSKEFIAFGDTKILNLTYLENDGALFGSFSGMRWILIAVTTALMIFCIYCIFRFQKEKVAVTALTLIVSGGIGNLIDRLFRGGKVVDYFDVQFMDFAIFNFADCCVVIGVILIVVQTFIIDVIKEKKKKQVQVSENE